MKNSHFMPIKNYRSQLAPLSKLAIEPNNVIRNKLINIAKEQMIIQVYTDILLGYCGQEPNSKLCEQNAHIIESIMQIMMLNVQSSSPRKEAMGQPKTWQVNSISNMETSGSQQRALQLENNKLKEIIRSHRQIIENLKSKYDDLKLNSQCVQCGGDLTPGESMASKQVSSKKGARDCVGIQRKKVLKDSRDLVNEGFVSEARGKLKINLGANLEDIKVEQNFQEEFMSKFNEFSLSWRQAAMKYQKQ